MDAAFEELTKHVNRRFAEYLDTLPGSTPSHTVRFSKRMTTSWALIYYRRHLVRLSPYVFLLEPHQLKHGTHWKELDATLAHEAVHAHLFAASHETGHSDRFHETLERFGVASNGPCDLGPENVAFRYHYACPSCDNVWPRRVPLRGNWSCGTCSSGRYTPECRMELVEQQCPWKRLATRRPWVERALADAQTRRAPELDAVPPRALAAEAPTPLVRAR